MARLISPHRLSLSILTFVFATVSALSSSPALADPQWYVSGNIGATYFSDIDASEANGTLSQLELDTGIFVSGAVGIRVADFFRGELEVSHKKNGVDSFSLNNINIPNVNGDTGTTAALANLYVDFLPEHKLRPYVSGGIGIATIKTDISGPTAIFTNGVVSDDSDMVFAWQVGLGASLAVTPNVDLTGGYRYFGTNDFNLDTVSVGGLGGHEIMIGARYNFCTGMSC